MQVVRRRGIEHDDPELTQGREVSEQRGGEGSLPRVPTTSRRRSLRWTCAVRVMSVPDRPTAIWAAVLAEQGTTTIPRVGRDPLAIGAPKSRSEYVTVA